jgi:hypothetical protein
MAEMRFTQAFRLGLLTAAICLTTLAQTTPPKEAQSDTRGMPPRASAADYQAHAQAGPITIAAEFRGHSIPEMEGSTLTTEEYVVVEVGIFGPEGTRAKLSANDFSLRINKKKSALESQPFGLVMSSVKDPEWEPPKSAAKSKTSMGGGGEGESKEPPAPVKVPLPVQRAMAQRVQKAALPEGDRTLPQAGLIFFQHRGKVQNIQSLELIYEGSGGKATLNLQP